MGALAEDYDIVERRGFKKGYDEGMQKGMQEGMQRGMQECIQKGMQEGMQKGMQEVFDSVIAEYTQLVIQAISEKGTSLDAALESIVNLKGYREPVRSNVLKETRCSE